MVNTITLKWTGHGVQARMLTKKLRATVSTMVSMECAHVACSALVLEDAAIALRSPYPGDGKQTGEHSGAGPIPGDLKD